MTPAGSPDAVAEGCTICKQMEQALTSHLFTGQFRLATREDEQERHSLGRGVLLAAHLADLARGVAALTTEPGRCPVS